LLLPGRGPSTNWCLQPAFKYDPDIAAYPKLSPPAWESTQSRVLIVSMSSRQEHPGECLMEPMYAACAGLDVHKQTVVACVRRQGPQGKARPQTRTFGTTTGALLDLSDWLSESGVTHVAMESTGVYWKPIWNILEGHFQIALVNAQHIKQVPGRKTDVKDAEWIAQLLQHGLLRGSFVPAAPQRELRELTRQRRKLIQARAAVANRIQKVLEDANIKLASVATDVLGVSGRAMLEGIIGGEANPEILANQARGRLRNKIPQLEAALRGRVTEHHRFLLRLLLDDLTAREGLIARLSERIEQVMPAACEEAVQRLVTIPGVDVRAAEAIVAEMGADMEQFPSAAHLSSWAGMCSGNNESAGKRKSGKTRKGNRWLREVLVQSAWAAGRTKDTYLSAQFRRMAGRRGKKRAAVVLGHTLLVIMYQVLKKRSSYRELGADYLDRLDQERLTRGLVRRLERLGHRVILAPPEPVA
jgi:transposase